MLSLPAQPPLESNGLAARLAAAVGCYVCVWSFGLGVALGRGLGSDGPTVRGRKFFLFLVIGGKVLFMIPPSPLRILAGPAGRIKSDPAIGNNSILLKQDVKVIRVFPTRRSKFLIHRGSR